MTFFFLHKIKKFIHRWIWKTTFSKLKITLKGKKTITDPQRNWFNTVFREMFDFPIVGPAQSTMHTACQLGHKFSLITIFDSMIHMGHKQAHEYGLSHHLSSVRAINIPVLELLNDLDFTFNKLKKLGKKIVKEDRADSVLFGCMTMSFAGLEKKLEKEIGIPVLNAGRVALKTLESMISMEISHSVTAYAYPVKLKKIKKNKIKISK